MRRSARSRGAAHLLLFIIVVAAVVRACRAATLESVLWSSSNPKFRTGRGLVLYPQLGDKMDIVCPRAQAPDGGKEEFYRVHLVSKSQLESCSVNKADAPLLNCDKPEQNVKFTFKFQEFSPNLWGLEFLKGRDYYITSTSTGSLKGMDNTRGGVCQTRSMKLVLRVGQNSSDPLSTLQESPTRFPPKTKTSSSKEKIEDLDSDAGRSGPDGDSEPGLLVWLITSFVILLLLTAAALLVLWRHHQRRSVPDQQQQQQQQQQPAAVSLNMLAVPKRDSVSSDNGSDRSSAAFPLRPSDSMICRHLERGSGEYGPPVYIVQEIMPQSPTNIYYKV
ncbi:ephrin-B2a [Austrofundulus limnaeus]|uniref:Ephrin-B2a n=1 Tax=Austrofundulus limnaeus TaxID=52670 RepID=A0A2I4ASN7_AUSLI|nr:PREDICTED: ephrin-B2 [Austrofundulus limnaeus]